MPSKQLSLPRCCQSRRSRRVEFLPFESVRFQAFGSETTEQRRKRVPAAMHA